jgi:hypothetical protein
MVPPRRNIQPFFVIAAISRFDHMPLLAASTKRFV